MLCENLWFSYVMRTNMLQLRQERPWTVCIFTESVSTGRKNNRPLEKSPNAIANVLAVTRVNAAASAQPAVILHGRKSLLSVGSVGNLGSSILRLRVFLLFLLHPLREYLLKLLMRVHALVN